MTKPIDRDMLMRLLESASDEGFHIDVSCWRTVTREDQRRGILLAGHTGPYRYGLHVRIDGLTTVAGLKRLIGWAEREGIELHQCGSSPDSGFEVVRSEGQAQFDKATPINPRRYTRAEVLDLGVDETELDALG